MIPVPERPKTSIHSALRFSEPGIRAVGPGAQLESVLGCRFPLGGSGAVGQESRGMSLFPCLAIAVCCLWGPPELLKEPCILFIHEHHQRGELLNLVVRDSESGVSAPRGHHLLWPVLKVDHTSAGQVLTAQA